MTRLLTTGARSTSGSSLAECLEVFEVLPACLCPSGCAPEGVPFRVGPPGGALHGEQVLQAAHSHLGALKATANTRPGDWGTRDQVLLCSRRPVSRSTVRELVRP